MHLKVLFCETTGVRRGIASDDLPDQDEEAVTPIVEGLRALGHDARALGATFDTLEALPELLAGCDAVFNLCDGSGVDGAVGPGAPAMLQHLGIPFTGCSADPYLRSIDKAQVRAALARAGVPIPDGQVCASEEHVDVGAFEVPVIVKPREGYGSLGVDHRSVVNRLDRLPAAIRRARRAADGDVLIERFVPGCELSVPVLGPPEAPILLPAVEFRFGSAFDGRPAIRTLSSKHDPTSAEYRDIGVAAARLEPAAAAAVEDAARGAWRAIGGDGYGRVDLRLGSDGRPYVIDVNTNCSLEIGPRDCDCATLVLAARLAGWGDARLLSTILEIGLARSAAGALPVHAATSGRWTPERGHTLHALRPIEEGEILGHLGDAPLAGRGARRPWRVGDRWIAPSPPLRWARAVHADDADALLEEREGGLLLAAARKIARFQEIRVGGRTCRRGTTVHLPPRVPPTVP